MVNIYSHTIPCTVSHLIESPVLFSFRSFHSHYISSINVFFFAANKKELVSMTKRPLVHTTVSIMAICFYTLNFIASFTRLYDFYSYR
ncbi:hypothetical protein K450DRAFT_232454 [Umbelopsis ramanniana AG]|uniref:Uncharacterized protein n=1 Tax=Umbelopsis ramanniana AG TaxID=1314678 RepID=A0AAD5EE19_UMBRA|nr:uncharacterized protein K450DRAFT_232454 [Umbelopsis ramanniana AG]KAI8581315.1 hypothetical protein K450DRAFT_232454 [Umbelopsis ramanniana AG]